MPMEILSGMYTVYLENRTLSYIFLTLLLLSIICQIIIGVIYLRLIRETDNMSLAKSKFLKQCKLKFINCYRVSGDVANVPVFVDKSLAKISFLGISMNGLHHLAGQFILLSIVAAGTGACQEITRGETVGKILPYYVVSFLGLYVYFSVSGLVDITGKKERLKINLVDYLENHMVNKLRQSDVDWEALTGVKPVAEKKKAGIHKRKALVRKEKIKLSKGKKKDKKVSVAGLDAADKKKQLREGIGLSAERGEKESAKVMAFSPAGVAASPAEPDEADSVARMEVEEIGEKPETGKGEEAAAAFSHQEAQELEELLRELLV